MSATPILQITEVAISQNNKEVTINDGFVALENATQAPMTVTFTTNAATLTATQFTGFVCFQVGSQTAPATLTIPLSERLFLVNNSTGVFSVTVGGSSGAVVVVGAGITSIIYCDGSNCHPMTSASTGLVTSATISFAGQPAPSREVLIPLTQNMALPANFSGTVGYADTAATSNAVFTAYYIRSGTTTSIGTLTFAASASSLTLSTQAAVSLLIGDVLKILPPSTQDVTLANCAITMAFIKS